MTLSRQTKFGIWAVAAVVIGLSSFFVGSALKPAETPFYVFDTDAPAFGVPSQVAATSPGGFTGFGETDGSNINVVLGGRVVQISDDALTLESTLGQRTSLTFAASPRILRIESASVEALRPGATVAVRLNDAGDTVEGVLILSQP